MNLLDMDQIDLMKVKKQAVEKIDQVKTEHLKKLKEMPPRR